MKREKTRAAGQRGARSGSRRKSSWSGCLPRPGVPTRAQMQLLPLPLPLPPPPLRPPCTPGTCAPIRTLSPKEREAANPLAERTSFILATQATSYAKWQPHVRPSRTTSRPPTTDELMAMNEEEKAARKAHLKLQRAKARHYGTAVWRQQLVEVHTAARAFDAS